jgi:hypothetical protein
MATDIDRLSDLANNASDLAHRSDRLDDHAAAAKAHGAAFRAARGNTGAAGSDWIGESRPSLAQTHLRRAAEHEKVATEPDSYAQKNVLARAATRKADREPTVATHTAAAAALRGAAKAWRAENPDKGKQNNPEGMPWELRDLERRAKEYEDQAEFLRKNEGAGAASAEV